MTCLRRHVQECKDKPISSGNWVLHKWQEERGMMKWITQLIVSKAQLCIYVGKHYILKSNCWHQGVGKGTRSDLTFVYTDVRRKIPCCTEMTNLFWGDWVQTQVHLLCPMLEKGYLCHTMLPAEQCPSCPVTVRSKHCVRLLFNMASRTDLAPCIAESE